MRWQIPSTTAVLPTPGSPTKIGLFLFLLHRIVIASSISSSLEIIGSYSLFAAFSVMLTQNTSSAGAFWFEFFLGDLLFFL